MALLGGKQRQRGLQCIEAEVGAVRQAQLAAMQMEAVACLHGESAVAVDGFDHNGEVIKFKGILQRHAEFPSEDDCGVAHLACATPRLLLLNALLDEFGLTGCAVNGANLQELGTFGIQLIDAVEDNCLIAIVVQRCLHRGANVVGGNEGKNRLDG